jgi:hypothetical protein
MHKTKEVLKMIYKCYDCGHIFEEGEQIYSGDGWNEPIISVCPVCGGSFEEAEICCLCGGQFLEDELTEGLCEDCIKEKIEEYSFNHITELYLMASNEKEEVELNAFIACMFSPSQINELLLRELVESDKMKNVDCSPFIKYDKNWFIEKISNDRG